MVGRLKAYMLEYMLQYPLYDLPSSTFCAWSVELGASSSDGIFITLVDSRLRPLSFSHPHLSFRGVRERRLYPDLVILLPAELMYHHVVRHLNRDISRTQHRRSFAGSA